MLPRSSDALIAAMRALYKESSHYLSQKLPINIVWEVAKLKELLVSYYFYQNNKNVAKTARDLNISRTSLAYYINSNEKVRELVNQAIEEDKKNLSEFYKKNHPDSSS
jgi:transcriptional regulator with AAA-type ATPase domain